MRAFEQVFNKHRVMALFAFDCSYNLVLGDLVAPFFCELATGKIVCLVLKFHIEHENDDDNDYST